MGLATVDTCPACTLNRSLRTVEDAVREGGDVYIAPPDDLGVGEIDLIGSGAFSHLDVLWEFPHYRALL